MWNVGLLNEKPYRNACKDAAIDDVLFACFRRLRPIREIVDNISFKPGYREQAEAAIACRCPLSAKVAKRLSAIDAIGNPPGDSLSPSMMRYYLRAMDLVEYFGSLDGMHIAEIGGGYGGLAAVIHAVGKPASYTIYDLPEPALLAKRYLSVRGITANFYGSSTLPPQGSYDLCISDYAIAELNTEARQAYADNVLCRSARGAVAWSLDSIEGEPDQLFTPEQVGDWLCRTMTKRDGTCSIKEWLAQFPLRMTKMARGIDTPFYNAINKVLNLNWGEYHFYWKPT